MPRRTIRTLNFFGAIALALALSAGVALAQQHSVVTPPSGQAAHFSDQQLQSFAKAALQIRGIAEKARASLQSAKSSKAKQSVLSSVESRQIQALKSNGLTVRQYEAISAAARKDPKMRLKIGNYVKQDLGKKK